MICLDVNVVLEMILKRAQEDICKLHIKRARDRGEDIAITTLCLSITMYYAERHKLDLNEVEQFLRLFSWLPLSESDGQRAFVSFYGKDFEDALQIACAKREGCKEFVTLDKPLAKKYAKDMSVRLLSGAVQ